MPENPLGKRLDALEPCWLEVHCSCQIAYLPLPLMAKNHGGGLLLGDVLPRLRCSKCGGRPKFMALIERPEPPRAGAPDTWRIELASA
jgi:hypothetical protein